MSKAEVGQDFISQSLENAKDSFSHLKNVSDITKKETEVLRFSTTENPTVSRGMTTSRIIAAGIITLSHIFALYCIYDMIFNLSPWIAFKWFFAALCFYVVSGTMGITAGAHRLFAHRSYTASLPARLLLTFMNSISNQGSIIHWSEEHRIHHLFVDSDADPHNINRGFFFAHMGWLFSPRTDAFIKARKVVDMSDLYADPILAFQNKHYLPISMFCCYLLPAIIAYAVCGDFLRGFFYLGNLRWVMCLHATWLVNSAAHMEIFGPKMYDPEQEAVEVGWVSLLSGGEGWHSYHHTYPFDYAASETGAADVYWRFNLARFWIDSMAALGWVSNRKVQRNPKRALITSPDQVTAIPAIIKNH